jgi:serine/threonine-protein kinase RsbW
MAGERQILATAALDAFVGRKGLIVELEERLAASRGSMLLATPGAGSTELLAQIYDHLFERGDAAPIYFSFSREDRNIRRTGLRFIRELAAQIAAFARKDANLLSSTFTPREVESMLSTADLDWYGAIGRIEATREEALPADLLRACLFLPGRAARAGRRTVVLIDHLHEALWLRGGSDLRRILCDIFSKSEFGFVICGRRRFIGASPEFARFEIDALPLADAGRIVELAGEEENVAVQPASKDLIAAQLGGRPKYIRDFINEAQGTSLETFLAVEQMYTESLFGGALGREMDRIFDGFDSEARTRSFETISGLMDQPGRSIKRSELRKRLQLNEKEFSQLMKRLHCGEVINLSGDRIEPPAATMIRDGVRIQAALGREGSRRAAVFGAAVVEFAGRAPQVMAEQYRRNAASDIRGLLERFDGRAVPAPLLDYGRYSEHLKGVTRSEVDDLLASGDFETIELPRIAFAGYAEYFYPAIAAVSDTQRAAVGLSVGDRAKTGPAWIGAEIDSKLEAPKDTAEFWCDRLEMLAAACDLGKHRIWLIAPEGFTPEALELLAERNAIGSNRAQFDLLREWLDAAPAAEGIIDTFEIDLPMGENGELIAAHAVEEVARRNQFAAKAVNQIKTAIVEACINAGEHSLSPDRRIHQRIDVRPDSIEITISNRGLRIADREPAGGEKAARRGWGLMLIEKLMDEVRILKTDDGTAISMTKYRQAA